MLKYNLDRLFAARGVRRPYSFLKKNGFSSNTASRYLNDKVKAIGLKQVEQLCLLFDCTPNDLLEWQPDKEIREPKKKALADLIHTDAINDVSHLLYKVPLDELDEVAAFLKSKVEGK